jgi:hypothetical protein
MTFGEVADMYIAAHEQGWGNPKHRQQSCHMWGSPPSSMRRLGA